MVNTLDFALWDGEAEFPDLETVAYLWCKEPVPPNAQDQKKMPAHVYTRFRKLVRDVNAGLLRKHRPSRAEDNRRIGDCYRRIDLRHYADQTGERPPFLFPEMREHEATGSNKRSEGQLERHARTHAEILGAAFSLLAAFPDQCKAKDGKVEATKTQKLIAEKALLFWADTNEPPLQTRAIEKLLRDWLNKTR